MEVSLTLMRRLDEVDQPLRGVLFAILEEIARQDAERVTREDVRELRTVVADLAACQRDLVAAQARTEARVEELAAAQARTEERVESLAVRVEELAAAQERTEARVEKLAGQVGEMVAAQRAMERALEETQDAVRELIDDQREIRRQMGGLADAVGYGIEDRLMGHLPAFVRREYGLEIVRMGRRFVEYGDGRQDEVNVLAECRDEQGRAAWLVVECKARPGRKDADRFAALIGRLPAALGDGTLHPLLVGYSIRPEVERYVRTAHPRIRLAQTHEVEYCGASWAARPAA